MPNIIINNYCNQKCSYCFAEDSMTIQKSPLNTQTLTIYLQVLKFLRYYWYKEVRLLWWEPLLHPDIKKILLLALKWWFNCLLFSNLNLPSPFIQSIFDDIWTKIRINCNLNNSDFYSETEYDNLLNNIHFLQSKGHEVIIWYNLYDFNKTFDDIALFTRKLSIKRINLKVTNTIAWKELIIDTGSRKYWEFIFNILERYSSEFHFEISCWLTKDIFTQEELNYIASQDIRLRFWCAGFAWEFDIDIDGSIYKCFPTRQYYLHRWLSIHNFNPREMKIESFWLPRSDGICSAHKVS